MGSFGSLRACSDRPMFSRLVQRRLKLGISGVGANEVEMEI